MLTVRTSENTVITSFRLISERQDFSSVRTGENTVRAREFTAVDSKLNSLIKMTKLRCSMRGPERSGCVVGEII